MEEGDGPPSASKFCGTPWIGQDAQWPECGRCHQPLPLFVQLDLGDLPEEIGSRFGTGLLQLFYCTRDECEGYDGWEPFADVMSRVRVVQPVGAGPTAPSPPRDESGLHAKRIVGWERFLDLPKPSEHRELGLSYTYNHTVRTVRVECRELDLVFEDVPSANLAEDVADSELGDKLAGWPAWIQNVEYPSCPRCGRRMVHMFQVELRGPHPLHVRGRRLRPYHPVPRAQGGRRLRLGLLLTGPGWGRHLNSCRSISTDNLQ